MLSEHPYDFTLIDLYLPKVDGFQVLAHLQHASLTTSAVLVTGHGSIASAVEAMKKGALDYITKPVAFDQLRIMVKKTLAVHPLNRKTGCFAKYRFENIIGIRMAMQRVFAAH